MEAKEVLAKIQGIYGWLTLGVHLGLQLHDLKSIEQQYQKFDGIERCKIEMIDLWLRQELEPTWSKLADALDKMNECALASSIRGLEPSCGGAQVASPDVTVRVEVSPALKAFRELERKFAVIVTQIMDTLEAKNVSVVTVHRFVCELLDLAYLPEHSKMNDLFVTLRSNAYYSFYRFCLLEDIVLEYLKGEECDQALRKYEVDLEKFKEGTKMREIVEKVTHAVEEEGGGVAPAVVLKMKGSFLPSTIKHFEQLVMEIFSMDLLKSLHHLKVKKGCISISWVVPQHKVPSLVEAASTKTQFMSSVGVLKLEISGKVIYESEADNNTPPLHQAVYNCDYGMVDQLVSLGIDVNEKDSNSCTSLAMACQRHHTNTKYGEVVRRLLEGGANPITCDNAGVTPLMKAVQVEANANKMAVIEQLTGQTGVGVDIADHSGHTSLMYAVQKGDLDLVLYLIDQGADINRVDGCGQSVVLLACMKGGEMVQALVDKGAKVDAQTNTGVTALMVAIRNNNTALAQELLALGAEPNIHTPSGWSALHEACKVSNAEILSALLDKGGEPNMRSKGTTPLMIACDNDFEAGVEILLQAGAHVNTTTDTNGITALSIAIYRGNMIILQGLLNAGADVIAKDQYGRDAMDLARSSHHPNITDLITSYMYTKETTTSRKSTSLFPGKSKMFSYEKIEEPPLDPSDHQGIVELEHPLNP